MPVFVNGDGDDEILVQALGDVCAAMAIIGRRGARRGARRAAQSLETLTREAQLILDVPLGLAAEKIHAALPAMQHPLLSGQSVSVVDRHRIRWIAGAGIFKVNPVVITVSLTSESYGTAVKVRGAAKDPQSVHDIVDELTGVLADLFDRDVADVID